ncbi:unnamed protein product [Cladocopium goreaui]|uniref:Ammonium transporter Rh type A (Erythrocyte membrane glycoprotein Rh50) (Rhesus blood group family type A glycoprotein) (Rh family type A glycoprotein) (Rh type A glycoprotein) (CD antigen CD241) n=1 Tax=Cladocopium goreaui TaxID=2562237 RepID=A0A9P1BGC1_9DINO|nr:unnamed protein product [Cladocopium goreaui]
MMNSWGSGFSTDQVFLVIFFRSTLDDSKLIIDDSTASRYFGVTLMIFLGFGYLRAFLKAYGLGAIGFTMLIASLGMQWSMILESLARKAELKVDSSALLHADLGVAAVLVSFGAVIGRISPTQIVMLVLLELPVYTINKVFLIHQFDTSKHVRDGGSTIVVHVFGAYFGLAAATVLGPAVKVGHLLVDWYDVPVDVAWKTDYVGPMSWCLALAWHISKATPFFFLGEL